ncbi:hypothetical protein BDN72DRAFT_779220, partial [Pluteus cervinus]
NHPLQSWLDVSDEFLSEELRREGRRGFNVDCCPRCSNPGAIYRCEECEGGQMLCCTCLLAAHRFNGLHNVEAWNGFFFERTTLTGLGLRFQLGHNIGEVCLKPVQPKDDDFVIIHMNGVHEVHVDFCGCFGAPERFVQVLRYGWFPATTHLPRTAASLQVLKHFQLHSFESKCSAFEFYQALVRLGDNVGIRPVRDRYRPFLTMVREYRHLKMLKRAGRGHDDRGIHGTNRGECAVLCPACPQPGRNLLLGRESLDEKDRWIHRLFLAIDANFRLKRRKVSTEEADPSLGNGWAYFVKHVPYMDHIERFADQAQPKSTCSSHSAVNNSRMTDGLSVSGVGSVGCARHDCMRPHAIGDLQKGERYANMDYLFLSSLPPDVSNDVVVSYDIACQWAINLLKRMVTYRQSIQHDASKIASFTYLVPKFHLPAHISSCQTQYSFNLHSHVGRTDGEAPERGWSHINPIALSTCEMGPGSRRDTLNDHFGDLNWTKTYSMGTTLIKRLMSAVEECNDQTFRFHQYDLGMRSKMAADVKAWEEEVVAWEFDRACPNPFETRIKKPTQETVRHELADEDRQAEEDGTAYVLHPMFSGSELVAVGLELEEQQRRLRLDTDALGLHSTVAQETKITTRGTGLHRRITQWAGVQERYVPGASTLREDEKRPANSVSELWEMPLFLPSSLPALFPCDLRLQDVEWRLRSAQGHGALDELRRGLRLRSYLYIDKDQFSRGQHQNTRSRTHIQQAEFKVKAAVVKYRAAHSAIAILAPRIGEPDWHVEFPVLKDDDVCPLRKDKKRPSEGRRKVSWIWGALGDGNIGEDHVEDLRVEWCKSRARARRWQEEVILLKEEMRRVLMFLDSEAKSWTLRSMYWTSKMGEDEQDGWRAYALQQAHIRLALKGHFESLWGGVDELLRLKTPGLLETLLRLGLIK